jgi:glucoside 3-dehydrogenase (cytochrome c) hitch-hiker subunit
MPNELLPFQVSRREVLKLLAGTAGSAATLPILSQPARGAVCSHAARPETVVAPAYTPKLFDTHQMETLAELVEIIIPTDEHSPGAKAARVHEYIDETVSDATAEQKEVWLKGLAAVDQLAERDFGQKFLRCKPDQQAALMLKISRNEAHPTSTEERFFKTLKDTTINGYYTSSIGIHQDLNYSGNTYLNDFPGCAHPEHHGT